MAAPCVFVVAEEGVHRALRALDGLTVWADRFDTCQAFYDAMGRGEVPLFLRPAVVVVSDSLADGPAAFARLLDAVHDLAVAVCWGEGTPEGVDVPCVRPPVDGPRLEEAVWRRTGGEPPSTDTQVPATSMLDDEIPLPVSVAERSFAGRVMAVSAATGLVSTSSTAVAFALASRLSLRGGHEVCVVGLHDDGGVLAALVSSRQPTLADLLAGLGAVRPSVNATLACQVRDNATGVRVLLPGDDLDLEAVHAEALRGVIDAARARSDVVVLDVAVATDAALSANVRLALDHAEGVVLVAERDDPPTVEEDIGEGRRITVLVYDAEGQSRPEAGFATGPEGAVALIPTVLRDGLGEAGLRYVASGEWVEQALDDTLAVVLPGCDLPPSGALESEFWPRADAPRRRLRLRWPPSLGT